MQNNFSDTFEIIADKSIFIEHDSISKEKKKKTNDQKPKQKKTKKEKK